MAEEQFDCIGIGMCPFDYGLLVDEYPAANTKTVAGQVSRGGGGPAPNAVYTLATLGCTVGLVASLGDDSQGNAILNELRNAGIDTAAVRRDSSVETPHAHIIVDGSNGYRTVILSSDDLPEIRPEQVPAGYLNRTRLLTLDSRPTPAIIEMVKRAKSHGVKVMLDAGSVHEYTDDLLPLVNYPVTSQSFVRQYFGHSDPHRAAATLVEAGAELAGVTLGSAGSVLVDPNGVAEIPAFPVKAVDTTGAGDLYHGGLLYGILHGWTLEQTGQFASAVAAIGCRSLGARSGLPLLAQVEKFLKKHGVNDHPVTQQTGAPE